jgi:hypothetical protein
MTLPIRPRVAPGVADPTAARAMLDSPNTDFTHWNYVEAAPTDHRKTVWAEL